MIQHRNIVLEAEGVSKSYPAQDEKDQMIEVLKSVDISVHQSEIAAIIGSSGSGKSTLLNIMGGLDRPDAGQIYWNRSSINDWTSDKLAEERNRQVGFIFQFHHLLPEFNALENVYLPGLIAGTPLKEVEHRASELLERLGMEGRREHRPSQLSGGEQQRVAIARALMNNPSIILADEPTGNLDEKNTEIILDLLTKLRETEQVAIVLITHEKDLAARCDTIFELRQGVLQPG